VPESLLAAGGAGILLGIGAISPHGAIRAIDAIGPTVGFLAALLVIAEGCRREGLFEAIGALLADSALGPPRRLLALVFAIAIAVTVVLGLDATVVLLTPVILAATSVIRRRARPYLYACAHLANSGSLLLPVSNLTNLLAFHDSGLTFVHFAALMALPTLAAVAIAWAGFARFFSAELQAPDRAGPSARPSGSAPAGPSARPSGCAPAESSSARARPPLPRYPLWVVGLTLAGFAISSPLGFDPVWVAAAGAGAITAPALLRRELSAPRLWRALEPGFLVFVLALAVVVRAASENGLGSAVRATLPAGATLPDLLAIAALAALAANLLNNLPATLLILPFAAGGGAAQVLAVLIGVNIGPNLAPPGSLATLLWRRLLQGGGVRAPAGEFVRLGLLIVPPALVACTTLLWLGLQA
jgi:arsenical pump membrane protein